jgi:acyl-CoA thioester hydrolase
MTNLNKFKHKTTLSVRFNDVDMVGVVNNSLFLVYFDEARFKYIKEIGLMPDGGWFADGRLYFIVRNEINYYEHARFDDELNVYTRISLIKDSSLTFEHVIENAKTKKIIADGLGILVHVDPITRKSAPFPDEYYDFLRKYEKDIEIIR